METYRCKRHVVSINETNAKRMLARHGEDGYIVISPCKGAAFFDIEDDDAHKKQKLSRANAPRINDFKNDLMDKNHLFSNCGFSYTPVYGGYIENMGEENEENVYETSFMVYNRDRNGKEIGIDKLYDFGIEMAKKYEQETFLFKAPKEAPKYITPNGETEMEFGADAVFNDFSQQYFTDLHKNSEKYADKEDGKPTRFTFVEAYINPTSDEVSARIPRHYKGKIFLPSR